MEVKSRREARKSCSRCGVRCEMKQNITHVGKRERVTCAEDCQHVSGSVQKYSVQYKGYNLIGVTTVEGGTTRGTTALF